jgi:(1->4)-alpha-D-glucan 1-alpha-D-glucosylmutase
LEIVKSATVDEVMLRANDGLPKLWLIYRILTLRKAHPELFGPSAAYEPLRAEGGRVEHVISFMRGAGAITIAPRWLCSMGSDWKGTTLHVPAGRWRNELTGDRVEGGRIPIALLMERFPVALLVRDEARR